MNLVCLALMLVSFFSAKANAQPSQFCSGDFVVVNAGDTCIDLGNGSPMAIQSVNPGLDCSALRVGQRVCIPFSVLTGLNGVRRGGPQSCPLGATLRRISTGDTCWSLAGNSMTGLNALATFNSASGLNCEQLRVGWNICVPDGVANNPNPVITSNSNSNSNTVCSTGRIYVVQSGDTCFLIGLTFGYSHMNLFNLNANLDCNMLMVGQRLCV
jgi:hypothetical protein